MTFGVSCPDFKGKILKKISNLLHTSRSSRDRKAVLLLSLPSLGCWQGNDIVPIPGTKKTAYLEENVSSLEIELTDEDLKTINDIAPKGIASGDRYSDMSKLNL